jgi:DNA-binding LytR/AlgR family response regulator
MLQIAICDDNRDDLSNMEQLISQYRKTKNLNCEYSAFSNSPDLVFALENGKQFNIYCLDIDMIGLTGIDVARKIRAVDQTARIAFLSSTNEFASQCYSVEACGCILKPITEEKLFPFLDELLEQKPAASCSEAACASDEFAIFVKTKDGLQKIQISNVVYAEGRGRKVLYHLR